MNTARGWLLQRFATDFARGNGLITEHMGCREAGAGRVACFLAGNWSCEPIVVSVDRGRIVRIVSSVNVVQEQCTLHPLVFVCLIVYVDFQLRSRRRESTSGHQTRAIDLKKERDPIPRFHLKCPNEVNGLIIMMD